MDFLKEFFVILCVCILHVHNFPFDLTRSDIAVEPSKMAGQKLIEWSKDQKRKGNAEEQGPYFEGDIIVSEARNGVPLEALRWPNGVIPYELKGNFTAQEKIILSNAIDEIKSKTCIKLIPRGNEKDYISFRNGNLGCFSAVGKVGGVQVVNLQSACFGSIGTPIHEVVHAIGFYHEQNRSDRDKYVRINMENISQGKYQNFELLSPSENSDLGVTYDFESVMHYSAHAFSSNGKPTIESIVDPSKTKSMGQRKGLSDKDVQKINRMYNCKK